MNNLKAQISLISGILLMIPCILFATAISTPADSLQNLLKDCPDAGKKAIIYVHLADIYVDSINIATTYWNEALTEAVKAEDEYITKLALDALVQRICFEGRKDSKKIYKYRPTGASGKPQRAIHRLSVLLQYLDGNEKKQFIGAY